MKNPFEGRQSLVYALSIFLLLSGWLASGYLGSDKKASTALTTSPTRSLIQKVRVRVPESERISQEVVLNGRTEPARAVTLRAEVEGRVIALGAAEGAVVREGDLIAQLDKRDRQARLSEARAVLKQREFEYAGTKNLQKRNLQSETQLANVASQLAAARALVEHVELEIRNTRLMAPFDGILDRLPVEVGTYLKDGDEVARVLEQNPIIFVGYVSQQERHRLVLGDKGIAHLMTGKVVQGELRYVASEADLTTRTFKVELEIPNPDGSLVSGLTAEFSIPVRFLSAVQLSPALLSLSNTDRLGIKVVNEKNRVEFLPIQVVKSTADGLWVTGLPAGIKVITVGQGFVHAGDKVVAVDEREIKDSKTGKQ